MRRRHKLRVQWFWWLFKWLFDIRRRVIWSDSFQGSDVCTRGRNPTSKLGMRESMGGGFFQEGRGRGVSLNIINMWGGGGVEIKFCLMRGGVWLSFGAYFNHFPVPLPPFRVIIAQSLRFNEHTSKWQTYKESGFKNAWLHCRYEIRAQR